MERLDVDKRNPISDQQELLTACASGDNQAVIAALSSPEIIQNPELMHFLQTTEKQLQLAQAFETEKSQLSEIENEHVAVFDEFEQSKDQEIVTRYGTKLEQYLARFKTTMNELINEDVIRPDTLQAQLDATANAEAIYHVLLAVPAGDINETKAHCWATVTAVIENIWGIKEDLQSFLEDVDMVGLTPDMIADIKKAIRYGFSVANQELDMAIDSLMRTDETNEANHGN